MTAFVRGERLAAPARVHTRIDVRWAVQFAVLLLPLAFLAVMAWDRRWTSDDGFINLRIVRQILAGHGPVFNAGDRVEAGTSPMWLGVLTLLDLVTPLRLEWIAALSAMAASVGGLAFAVFGTRTALDAAAPGNAFLLPLGALVYAAVPVAWDFATSGLEMGLCLLWLGAVWCLICRRVVSFAARERPPPWWVAVLAGLGPLLRPDVAAFSVAFVLALLVTSPGGVRTIVRVVATAAIVPVVVQLARMAYYGAIVPNTALAKEATRSRWDQGWEYFANSVASYWLWVPIATLAVLAALQLRRRTNREARIFRIVAAIVAGAGLVHALYVVRVGGDFMVGRLLLPSLFAVLLPVSVVRVAGWRWAGVLLVVVWAVTSIGWLRAPDTGSGVVDERAYWSALASVRNPVTIDDYGQHLFLVGAGRRAARMADRGDRLLILNAIVPDGHPVRLAADVPAALIANLGPLGAYGYAAGIGVDVVDVFGLADPIAARLRLRGRGRPGHEKIRDDEWLVARYAAADAPLPPGVSARGVEAARRALRCGELREVIDAVSEPLDVSRALDNVVGSISLSRLRIDPDPVVAERELCRVEARHRAR